MIDDVSTRGGVSAEDPTKCGLLHAAGDTAASRFVKRLERRSETSSRRSRDVFDINETLCVDVPFDSYAADNFYYGSSDGAWSPAMHRAPSIPVAEQFLRATDPSSNGMKYLLSFVVPDKFYSILSSGGRPTRRQKGRNERHRLAIVRERSSIAITLPY